VAWQKNFVEVMRDRLTVDAWFPTLRPIRYSLKWSANVQNAPTIGSNLVHFEKKRSKHNVTAQAEWRDTRALDWPDSASGLLGCNHCCPGLAQKIQHFVENENSGREALFYKQGT
jgi:hypothetical protein